MSMKQTMCEFVHGMTCEEVSRFVGSIVRCRDCEFGAYDGNECMRIDEWDSSSWFPVEPDGFCAWGERNAD